MRAVEISKPGSPEVLRPVERRQPKPKPNEILIKVAAAGVNRPDVLQRSGNYAVPPDASDLPGLEVAGSVTSIGSAVSMWKPGDKVCALVHGGGYAEYCVAPEAQALPVPKGLSLVEAAALPETFFTVWGNVYERGGFAPGETLRTRNARHACASAPRKRSITTPRTGALKSSPPPAARAST